MSISAAMMRLASGLALGFRPGSRRCGAYRMISWRSTQHIIRVMVIMNIGSYHELAGYNTQYQSLLTHLPVSVVNKQCCS